MDDATLRRVQLVQLEIAKEVKRVCEKNNIEYFMDGGTLLGAVRHGGFIPWDDDLDFGFTRKNYEKFLSVAQEQLSDCFFLQTWDSDPAYGYAFAKIRKKGTVYQERICQENEANSGIFVDLFPYDYLPKQRLKRNIVLKKLTLIKMLLKVKVKYKPWNELEHINFRRWLIYLPIRLLASVTSKRYLKQWYMKVATDSNWEKSEYIYPQVAEKLGVWLMKSSYFKKYTSLPFEDDTFSAPICYREFLTDGYGDYMTPPPKEKRVNIHGIVKIDFGE